MLEVIRRCDNCNQDVPDNEDIYSVAIIVAKSPRQGSFFSSTYRQRPVYPTAALEYSLEPEQYTREYCEQCALDKHLLRREENSPEPPSFDILMEEILEEKVNAMMEPPEPY